MRQTHSAAGSHWETVYATRAEWELSWQQEYPALSLELIKALCPDQTGRILDVGGGDSNLVDHLLEAGYQHLTVLDISEGALHRAQGRLGPKAGRVRWLAADITQPRELGPREVWHDRAVFHFLTRPGDRAAYVAQAAQTVVSGGGLLVATFALDGPEYCSGLPVCRYDAESLTAEFADAFEAVRRERETHVTPWGASQEFVYVAFRRRGA